MQLSHLHSLPLILTLAARAAAAQEEATDATSEPPPESVESETTPPAPADEGSVGPETTPAGDPPEAEEPPQATFEPAAPEEAPQEDPPPRLAPAPLTPAPSPPPPQPPTSAPPTPADPAPASSTPPPSSNPPPSGEAQEKGSGGGLYLDGNLGGTYGINSTHEWNDTCPVVEVESDPSLNWDPSCSASVPLGMALEGRLGVRLGALGLEGFGLGAFDWSSGKLEGEEPSVELPGFARDMQIGRIGGGFGGGLRLMSNGFVRVSAGAGGGIIFRHVFTNVSSLDGSSTGYTAPLVKGDLSLTFGKFLNLGVLGWVEFSPDVKVTPDLSSGAGFAGFDPDDPNIPPETAAMLDAFENALGDVTVFEGPQLFIGPYLGLHFGK